MESIKSCTSEMSSLSLIHYYVPTSMTTSSSPAPSSPPHTDTCIQRAREVCDSHTDTGILTFIVCSRVPGLEIWDSHHNVWLNVERDIIKYKEENDLALDHHHHRHIIMCIMGEKIGMFTGASADQLRPTRHRVVVDHSISRTSLLYFMDTAK
eukprot:TRINITY_DN4458_c0_g1_i1.p1 TRINITY_DN4458_c0_g1~~TRINITY_DN4458_c0_g1_i1.p1  ORF type:complete len:153 (+),score=8.94 TRINITY_DN4458_c0_g1_i1:224-682(+)